MVSDYSISRSSNEKSCRRRVACEIGRAGMVERENGTFVLLSEFLVALPTFFFSGTSWAFLTA